jgi:hypothetical protein
MTWLGRRTSVLGLALGAIVLSAPASAASEYFDSTSPIVTRWKLAYQCKLMVDFLYELYPPDHPDYGDGFRTYRSKSDRTRPLPAVLSRRDPTLAERAILDEHEGMCRAVMEVRQPALIERACRKLKRLGIDTDIYVTRIIRPLERVTIATDGHPPYPYEIPPDWSYYTLTFGFLEFETLDSGQVCP